MIVTQKIAQENNFKVRQVPELWRSVADAQQQRILSGQDNFIKHKECKKVI